MSSNPKNPSKYSSSRAVWWVDRSRSLAHQKAYREIASLVSPSERSVVVDYCCGNGELLKKVYFNSTRKKRFHPPLLIGTDISSEMLELAVENLQSSGIEAKIVEDAQDVVNHRGIVLVKDDLIDSQLPLGISDITLLTFPELEHDPTLVRKFIGENPLLGHSGTTYNLQYHWLSRVTKRGRNVILVDYTRSKGGKSDLDRKHFKDEYERAERFGLKLVRIRFVADSEVFRDLEEKEQDRCKQQGGRGGYEILICQKR